MGPKGRVVVVVMVVEWRRKSTDSDEVKQMVVVTEW